MMPLDLSALPGGLLLGTSSWSWPDWKGLLYSKEAREKDFIAEYSRRLPTVEIDSTFYRSPSFESVDSWREKTPEGFIFSAKVPQAITHEKCLVGCGKELTAFVQAMSRLGGKLGPMVFQFPYMAKGKDPEEYRTGAEFRRRLEAFLKELPRDFLFAAEIRNRTWLDAALLGLLAERRVALVLTDYYTMPSLSEIETTLDPLTAGFAYVRFLGDRKRIDELVARKRAGGKERSFDELLLDRTAEMRNWIPSLRKLLERTDRVFAYFNNHYAGCGPMSIDLFRRVWEETGPAAPPAV